MMRRQGVPKYKSGELRENMPNEMKCIEFLCVHPVLYKGEGGLAAVCVHTLVASRIRERGERGRERERERERGYDDDARGRK